LNHDACKERQEKLNKLFPFTVSKAKELTSDEIEWLKGYTR
jgi:hypothetical protein